MSRCATFALVIVACSARPDDVVCDAGVLLCDGTCVGVQLDDNHCGSCRHVCGAGEACAEGQCFPTGCGDTPCGPDAICTGSTCTEKLCLGVACADGFACHGGACEPESCGAQSCPPGSVCVDNACTDVACTGVRCSGGERCFRGGCLDAGTAGCDAGQGCGGNRGPCNAGVVACDNGVPVCVDGAARAAGTPCGSAQVCSPTATCIACSAGVPCATNPGAPCRTGRTSCATGAITCVDTDAGAPQGQACGPPGHACFDDTCVPPPLNYYGTGADGVVSTSGDLALCDATVDGDMCVMNLRQLNLHAGHTVTTAVRRRGLLIYVDGDAIIDGTLTMTARGAAADPSALGVSDAGLQLARIADGGTDTGPSNITGAGAEAEGAETHQQAVSGNGRLFTIARDGAAGARLATVGPCGGPGQTAAGSDGATGARQSGGGGSGAANCGPGGPLSESGAGAAGSCFSGGSGGGAGVQPPLAGHSANPGAPNGGPGGAAAAYNASGGGGAGNPGGAGEFGGSNGGDGSGGLLILIVRGRLTIGASGVVSADGVSGGAGAVGGGSSGGGSVLILHAGPLVNNGVVRAAGGAAVGGVNGGKGGDGSVQIAAISP